MNWKNLFISLLALLFAVPSISEAQISKLDRRFGVNKKAATTSGVTKRNRVEKSAKKTSDFQNNKKPQPSYVLLEGPYNEVVKIPSWLNEELSEVNAQLAQVLSQSEYWEIIIGELEIYGEYKTKEEYLRALSKSVGREDIHIKADEGIYRFKADMGSGTYVASIEEVKNHLKKIVKSPQDKKLFRRAHFTKSDISGIHFKRNLRYEKKDIITQSDTIVSTKEAGNMGSCSMCYSFWDPRTCEYLKGFQMPVICGLKSKKEKGEDLFACWSLNDENHSKNLWYGIGGHVEYLISPRKEEYLIWNRGGSRDKYSHRENNLLKNFYDDSNWKVFSKFGYNWTSNQEMDYRTRQMRNDGRNDQAEFSQLGILPDTCTSVSKVDGLNVAFEEGENSLEINFADLNYKIKKNVITKLETHVNADSYFLKLSPRPILDSSNGGSDGLGANFFGEVTQTRIQSNYQCSGNDCDLVWLNVGTDLDTYSSIDSWGSALLLDIKDRGKFFFENIDWFQNDSAQYSGKIVPYEEAVKLGINWNSKVMYENDSWPYTRSSNVKISCQYQGFLPYVRTMEIYQSSDDEKIYVLSVTDDDFTENAEVCMLLEVDVNNQTYKTVFKSQYERHRICPSFIFEKRWLLKPVNDYKYEVIQFNDEWKESKVGDLYVDVNRGYALVLPDGTYAGSPGCEAFLGLGDGKKSIGMEALAPWKNRPAKVLEAIGGNVDDIVALTETTKRWLRKRGVDPDNMPPLPELNEFPTIDVKLPNLHSPKRELEFKVDICATKHSVKKMVVRVDGVIVPQLWDDHLSVAPGTSQQVDVRLSLGVGQNWIELVPIDEKGIAGAPYRFRTIYKGNYSSDLYVVTLGVSDYDDNGLELQYAAKDAKDLAVAFEKYAQGRVKVLTLTDKEICGIDSLEVVKAFLAGATLDDKVVFYVAGHGMLDDKLDYYYAPAAFDVERIKETGISMDALVDVLQGCKARKRLLLLDTCHSGLLGEEGEDQLAMSGVQLPHGVRAIQNRGMKVKKAIGGLKNVAQKKRYIESMFAMDTQFRGINVVSGSAGAEFALESSEWGNGVFTSAIIQVLSGLNQQDDDKNGNLSIGELARSVISQVQSLTANKQSPNIVAMEDDTVQIAKTVCGEVFETKNWQRLIDVAKKANDEQLRHLLKTMVEDLPDVPLYVWKEILHDISKLNFISMLLRDKELSNCKQFGSELREWEWKKQCTEVLKELVKQENSINDVDENGTSLLMYAVESCNKDIVVELIRKGASVDAFNKYEKNALMYAIGIGNKEIINELIKAGADVNLVNKSGVSTLMYAVDIEGEVKLLLKAGADVNAVDSFGRTALMCAVAEEKLSIVRELMEFGADVSLKDKNGKSALDYARRSLGKTIQYDNDWKKIIQLLEATERGGDNQKKQAVPQSELNKLLSLYQRLEKLKCKQEDSKVQQKVLLSFLPRLHDRGFVRCKGC